MEGLTIVEIGKRACKTADEHGFHYTGDKPRALALIHSEVSEALEVDRNENKYLQEALAGEFGNGFDHAEFCGLVPGLGIRLVYNDGALPVEYYDRDVKADIETKLRKATGQALVKQREDFVEELADVVIRVANLAEAEGLNLGAAIECKLLKNESRPFKHGGKAY